MGKYNYDLNYQYQGNIKGTVPKVVSFSPPFFLIFAFSLSSFLGPWWEISLSEKKKKVMLINFSKKFFRKTRLNVISEWPKETMEPSDRVRTKVDVSAQQR